MNRGGNFVLLETVRRDQLNKNNLLFEHPVKVLACHDPKDVRMCFRKMEKYLAQGYYLAGFFSYELGYVLEEALAQTASFSQHPLLRFGVFEQPPRRPAYVPSNGNHYYLTKPQLEAGRTDYSKAVSAIRDLIVRGETYQINYTTKCLFDFTGNVFDFYAALKARQKVSYSSMISFDGDYILSLSPELFFRIDRRRNITVKPMKGTAPISTPPAWLSHDPKNTSENVMIVDLLRNDLGRICTPGTVRVQELFKVEEYETLWQMTSTVTGKLKADLNYYDIIKSLFPCGSVTGAPKIQSMKIIRSLEKEPRNIYTGAIGYFAPNGEAVFNVAIRTIDLKQKSGGGFRAAMGVGSGIVFDSQADAEYEECRLKAKFLMDARPDFALIETMLFEKGRIRHLNQHLARLKASAGFFAIPWSIRNIRSELKKYAGNLSGGARVRLLLKSSGEITLEHSPVPAKPENPVISISGLTSFSDDPFLHHKTTHRRLYDEEYRKYSARGYFDIIFTNEKSQITEGAISNIFVRQKGRWYTPSLACGLLAGIERNKMIRKLKAQEKILYAKDLQSADQILLTNSVRGAIKVVLEG